jgi:hypothetical protein
MWQPRFPSRELVDQAAALFPHFSDESRKQWLTEGPRPFVRISPGAIEVRSKDFAKANRTAERAVRRHEIEVDLLAAYIAEHGECPGEPTPTRMITEWSRKSRVNMRLKLAQLDYTPMYEDRTRVPGMMTVTYPGDWLPVAPNGREVKRHLKMLRKRYERAWGEPLRCVWKLEFQHRGAPHVHFLMAPPHGEVDGQQFRQWLSRTWAEVVAHPDAEEYRRHLLAGTAIDYVEGMKAADPRRIATYFSKHSQFKAKEYQHRVPDEWAESGVSVGRFWGYWGLEVATAVVELGQAEATVAARTMRRWADAQQVTREVSRPRVRRGRVCTDQHEVIGLAGAYLVESRKAPRMRRSRTRARRMRGNRGFVVVNNGPEIASQLARYLNQVFPDVLAGVDAPDVADERHVHRDLAAVYRARRMAKLLGSDVSESAGQGPMAGISVFTDVLMSEGSGSPGAPGQPCTVCREPLDPVLAPHGRHLLCR